MRRQESAACGPEPYVMGLCLTVHVMNAVWHVAGGVWVLCSCPVG